VKGASVLFSSQASEWSTPRGFFDELDTEFHFTLDACATEDNALVSKYFDSRLLWSALTFDWTGVVWMNPPYGPRMAEWMEKAYRSSLCGATVVCLVPSRTDTRWWHDYAMKATEIRFIKGRLKFDEHKNSAPFPSAIVIFKPSHN